MRDLVAVFKKRDWKVKHPKSTREAIAVTVNDTAVDVYFTALYLKYLFLKELLRPTGPANLNDSCNKLKWEVLLPLKGSSFITSE